MLLAVLSVLGWPATARADDEVRLRGNYWRDQNTRVIAPEATLRKEYATGTTVEANYLLDVITSASVSAGVLTDQPFTELRNEVGGRVSQKIGPASISGLYRYSTESDYWAHTGGLTVAGDLLQKNLTVAATYVYGHSEAAQRVGADNYLWADRATRKEGASALNSHFAIVSASQVLTRWMLLEGSYELSVLDGFQANAYRTVLVAGAAMGERVPNFRVRHAFTVALRLTPVYRKGPLHHLGLYAKYRFYVDDWGVTSHAPEVRAYAALGPVTLRIAGRYYTQSKADFYVDQDGTGTGAPMYQVGVDRAHCGLSVAAGGLGCFTGDSKLGAFSTYFLEGRIDLSLKFLSNPKVPFSQWVGRSLVGVSLGHLWNDHYNHVQFGDAWVGGLEVVTPL